MAYETIWKWRLYMNLKKHIIDTIKEWQLKIGYKEGNMKLYYPGDSLVSLLGIEITGKTFENTLTQTLTAFCNEVEPVLGRIQITGSYERYCLDIPAKGCAYIAETVPDSEFLKLFLDTLTRPGSTMTQIRECFAAYATSHGSEYVDCAKGNTHTFYFVDNTLDEYVYWVEENEFGLTYHRFTRADYEKLKG